LFKTFTERPIALIGDDGKKVARQLYPWPPETLLQLLWDMLRARLVDERLVTLLRQGKTSFYAQSSGMEATQVALAHAIRIGHDWVWPYYRDQGLVLTMGLSLPRFLAQLLGTKLDYSKGRQMPHHFSAPELRLVSISSSIASEVPPATGTAMAQKYLGTDEITVCTFGDGATSEGDWHAGLNMAAVQQAPVLFVCENNQWAVSAGLRTQTAAPNLAIKAQGYGMPGYYVDGQDVLACLAVLSEAAEQVRREGNPVLVECLSYRYGTHSSADDDSSYRSPAEVASWKARDPIQRFQRFLERQGLLPSEEERRAFAAQVQSELEAAAKEAEAGGSPAPEELFDDVYSDLPDHLAVQRALLLSER
jgi:2-oxoisovalerate dehydrogenase E1 component alpha subunit